MLQAPIVQSQNQGTLELYRKPVDRPWRLLDALQQVYSDGWCPEWCSYTYFKPNQRGTLLIPLGRTGLRSATAPPGRVRISVGTVRIDRNGQTPVLEYV